MKKFAMVLSGCGFKDGAEVTESVIPTLLLSKWGAEYEVFAPNQEVPSVNHRTNEEAEKRNIMTEASRLSRGKIRDLEHLEVDHFDGLILPGGFGVALHLSSWAKEGSQCQILPKMEDILFHFYKQSKPIGAFCIAPVLVAKVLGSQNVILTVGEDKDTIQEIEKTGAQHEVCPVTDYVTDRERKVVTTPAYMYEASPHEVFQGIEGALKELFEMA